MDGRQVESLRNINKPLGVSTYQLEEVVEWTAMDLEQRNSKEKTNAKE